MRCTGRGLSVPERIARFVASAALEPAAVIWGRFCLDVPVNLDLTSTTYLHPLPLGFG